MFAFSVVLRSSLYIVMKFVSFSSGQKMISFPLLNVIETSLISSSL